MRALSVRQPWAQAILDGIKRVENRTWKTSYRGQLVIHASKTVDDVILPGLANPSPQGWATGAHVGTVHLVGIHVAGRGCGEHCAHWGLPGVWHWELANPCRLSVPVLARGYPGLFPVVL